MKLKFAKAKRAAFGDEVSAFATQRPASGRPYCERDSIPADP